MSRVSPRGHIKGIQQAYSGRHTEGMHWELAVQSYDDVGHTKAKWPEHKKCQSVRPTKNCTAYLVWVG